MTTMAERAATRFLEESKIHELAKQLQQEGYEVERSPRYDGITFDLVARKDNRSVVFDVKAVSADPESVLTQINKARAEAFAHGFDEFRVVAVNPPHETNVDIVGLREQLLDFIGEYRSGELDDLPGQVYVDDVDVDRVDTVEITVDGIRVVGAGTVAVKIDAAGGAARDGMTWDADFTFTFDAMLSHALQIEASESSISIDTSSFYE